jgi:molybdenum cofactor cytidylyltransferase
MPGRKSPPRTLERPRNMAGILKKPLISTTEQSPAERGSGRLPGIVLMAGLSSRMGLPKALLPLGGQPALVRILSEALASRLDRIVLVLGARSRMIRQALGELRHNGRLSIVYNPAYRQGLSTSVIKGLGRIDPEASGVMFLMGDQPLLRAAVINRLIRKFLGNPDCIVVPQYGSRPGNPVTFPASLIPELKKLTGDRGGREIIRSHPDRVCFQPVRPARAGWDMDTREDYEKIKEWIDEKSQG